MRSLDCRDKSPPTRKLAMSPRLMATSSRMAVTGSRVCWTPNSMSLDHRRSAAGVSMSGSWASSLRKGRRKACGSSRRHSHAPPFISSENRAAAASLSRRPSANGSLSF